MRKTIINRIPPAKEEKIEFIFSDSNKDVASDDDEYIKSPMENALEALENFKKPPPADEDENLHTKYMADICDAVKNFKKADYMPDNFMWYEITTLSPLADISCFSHILHTQGGASSFAVFGYYLMGIKDNILCFALPVEKGSPNPIPHLDDCTVNICAEDIEFCTVCVSLEADGQYFMPIG